MDIVQSVSSTLISFLATANTYFDTEKSILIDLIMTFFYFERPATWRMSSINMAVQGRVSNEHAPACTCATLLKGKDIYHFSSDWDLCHAV